MTPASTQVSSEPAFVHEEATPFYLRLLLKVMHRYWLVSRGVTFGVRAVVLDGEGQVCLVRHTYVAGWHLPGGGVEAGEPALRALVRELREEAAVGLDGTCAPELHGVFLNTAHSRRDHVLVYVVRAFERLGVKRPDREIAEAGFFPLDALPPGTTGATRARLAEVMNGVPPTPTW